MAYVTGGKGDWRLILIDSRASTKILEVEIVDDPTDLRGEDPERDILIGLLRLRKCSDDGTFRPELVKKDGAEGGCSIVRELHVYGTAVPVHGRDPTKFQHQVRVARRS